MSIIKEFKDFAVKGNAFDMAVGIIIGAAFTTVVKSIVDDIIMPVVGLLTGGINFSDLFINLSDETFSTLNEAKDAGAATLNYGLLINAVITFLIVAWILFLLVKAFNKTKKAEPESSPTTKNCKFCKTEIHLEATKCPNCTSEV